MRWSHLILVFFIAFGFLNGGCSQKPEERVLRVLAGSELKDLEPMLEDIRNNTGIRLEMDFIGTLDGAEKLLSGEAVDLAWFSHGKYLSLLQGNRVAAQEKIMLSPVVLGVKEGKARDWGWMNNPNLTWRDITLRASSGELRYAMTNPAASNSGFTALVGVAAALAGSGDVLQSEAIDHKALQGFFKGQTLTAGSSGWLAESYVRESDRLDGMINYESVLMQLNDSGRLDEQLYLVYPKEGIITADYPLMLINSSKREDYQKLVAYLRSTEFQRAIMEQTLRRPVIPQVKLSDQFPTQLMVELPFPNNLEVINGLLFAYLDEQRIPSHAIFVLDVSGSMAGERLAQLKTALNNLTGLDRSLTGEFSRFRGRERITLVIFNHRVQDIRDFQINNPQTQGADMQRIRHYVGALQAEGGTAIFSALKNAYDLAAKAQQADTERYYSIVLMSDGQNRDGISQGAFQRHYRSLPEDVRRIKTFTVLFGDVDVDSMAALAESTGGRVFEGRTQVLSQVFKHIRGYQ